MTYANRKYAYDPIPLEKPEIKRGDVIAVKDISGKYFAGLVTYARRTQGKKYLYTVDGIEHELSTVRKCYPAI